MVTGQGRYRFEEVSPSGRPLPALLRYAIGRSRSRRLVLMALATRSPQYASELARSTSMTVTNVVGATVGGDERYAPDLSLVSLGLVAEAPRRGSRLRIFHITAAGLAFARTLTNGRHAVEAAAGYGLIADG